MATITLTPIKTFVSGEWVTPGKLNQLSQSTVALTAATIVAADIAPNAVINAKLATGINAGKLTTGTLPIARIADEAIVTAKIADGAIVTAKIANEAIVTAKIDDGAVTAAKLSGAQTGPAPIYGCRAWVRFNGQQDTGGVTSAANTDRLIIASGNVDSVLRTGAGQFTVTFTTPMPTEDYAAVVSTNHSGNGYYAVNAETNIISSSAVQIVTGYNSTLFDPASADLAVFV